MTSKEKRCSFIRIATRIGVSIFSAFASFIIWATIYDDMYYYGYDSPYDYLANAWDDFYIATMMCIGVFIISLLFIWKLFSFKQRLITAGFITILIISCAMFNTYQKNILEIHEVGEWMEEVNLKAYEPFCENTLAKNLDEKSSLSLQDNLPRLDGATALYPLYASFASATYPTAEYRVYDENSGITCSRTHGAFNNLLDGSADIIFLMGISEEQREQAEERGLELILMPIGKEAFVFFVNRRNSASNFRSKTFRVFTPLI